MLHCCGKKVYKNILYIYMITMRIIFYWTTVWFSLFMCACVSLTFPLTHTHSMYPIMIWKFNKLFHRKIASWGNNHTWKKSKGNYYTTIAPNDRLIMWLLIFLLLCHLCVNKRLRSIAKKFKKKIIVLLTCLSGQIYKNVFPSIQNSRMH
jgi:hypothetical protein